MMHANLHFTEKKVNCNIKFGTIRIPISKGISTCPLLSLCSIEDCVLIGFIHLLFLRLRFVYKSIPAIDGSVSTCIHNVCIISAVLRLGYSMRHGAWIRPGTRRPAQPLITLSPAQPLPGTGLCQFWVSEK